jgi:hypothetical protein
MKGFANIKKRLRNFNSLLTLFFIRFDLEIIIISYFYFRCKLNTQLWQPGAEITRLTEEKIF